MIRWYADDTLDAPEPVECEHRGHPHPDAKGRTQYVNSHYDDPADAWARLMSGARAGVSLAAGEVEHARAMLAKAEARLVDRALHRERVERALEERSR